VLLVNGDISGCDASHSSSLFAAFLETARTGKNLQRSLSVVVDQCRSPLKIRSVETPKARVEVQFDHARLYSGVVLTTAINSFAVTLIVHAISGGPLEDLTLGTVSGELARRSETAGYDCTFEVCIDPSHLMFLKNIPVYDTSGDLQSVLALGVLGVTSGRKKGDYLGRGPLLPRILAQQASLLAGMYPNLDNPFINQMKEAARGGYLASDKQRAAVEKTVADRFRYKRIHDDQLRIRVTNDELFRRYDLTQAETAELMQTARNGPGDASNIPAMSKILMKDYGLTGRV
jgi:hypothetical protein